MHVNWFVLSAPIILLILFFISYTQDRRKLLNGFLFNLFLISLLIASIEIAEVSQRLNILLLLFIPIAIVLFFGIYALIVFLFWNAYMVLKREGRALQNLLTLLLAILLTMVTVYNWVIPGNLLPAWMSTLLAIVPVLLFYFACVFLNFLSASWIYSFRKPKKNQDYIIVLGSGLIDGHQVPPLLASRIQKGLDYYFACKEQGYHPKMIFSGGRGSDESLSESEAMYLYAIEKGLPPEDGIKESRSVNTYQNMLFSKQIIEQRQEGKAYNCMFVTNYFHVFRAALFTKIVGLYALGVGSPTTFYYVPNAILREFVAILSMKKKRHVVAVVILVLFIILIATLTFFAVRSTRSWIA